MKPWPLLISFILFSFFSYKYVSFTYQVTSWLQPKLSCVKRFQGPPNIPDRYNFMPSIQSLFGFHGDCFLIQLPVYSRVYHILTWCMGLSFMHVPSFFFCNHFELVSDHLGKIFSYSYHFMIFNLLVLMSVTI